MGQGKRYSFYFEFEFRIVKRSFQDRLVHKLRAYGSNVLRRNVYMRHELVILLQLARLIDIVRSIQIRFIGALSLAKLKHGPAEFLVVVLSSSPCIVKSNLEGVLVHRQIGSQDISAHVTVAPIDRALVDQNLLL